MEFQTSYANLRGMASASIPLKRAVFLDRDGTINFDPGYLNDADRLEVLEGVSEALKKLQSAGFLLVVTSNQSGVGRGLITPTQIQQIHERLDLILSKDGVKIDHYELCIHHPGENCECRKPLPKLILDSAEKLGIDVSRSFMIGDKASDVESGWNARCQASILVLTGYGEKEHLLLKKPADFTARGLEAAANWILAQV